MTLRGAQAGVDARGDRGPESRINSTSTSAPPLDILASDVTVDAFAEGPGEVWNTFGSNISFRKSVFEAVGGFDTAIGGCKGDKHL